MTKLLKQSCKSFTRGVEVSNKIEGTAKHEGDEEEVEEDEEEIEDAEEDEEEVEDAEEESDTEEDTKNETTDITAGAANANELQ
ncbi:MAG: hypothetical protein ACRDF4_04785 [Rhabdochlamydiaceae bacterium]